MEVRSCFVPRGGRIFGQIDYPALELHALAQACIDLLGYSSLATAINNGLDPHLAVAAQILKIPYAEAKARKKEDEVDKARQVGKVVDFGVPGGLGAPKLVMFAKKGYGVHMTEEEAKGYKKIFLETWPEMKDYFALVAALTRNQDGRDGKGRATFQHLRSKRWRGGATYTSACNSYFQGLGADATTAAGYAISKACYVEKNSPLFGSRIVNFVHDEFILETDVGLGAGLAANEMGRIAAEVANEWMPDCPFQPLEALLMSRWSKAAFPVFDSAGNLAAWRPEDWKIVKKETVPVDQLAWRKENGQWRKS